MNGCVQLEMTSIVDAEFYFDEDAPFRTLPESAQQVLADRLMPDAAWKLVADRLGFSAVDIDTLAAGSWSPAQPPSYRLLHEWGWRSGSTLRVLGRTLDHVGRSDIILLLDDIRKRESTSPAVCEHRMSQMDPRDALPHVM